MDDCKNRVFPLIIWVLFCALLAFPVTQTESAKKTRIGEIIMLDGVKLTPLLNDSDSFGSVDVAGARIVVTLQFNERKASSRPYYCFRMDTVPEKSDLCLLVGSTKIAPKALRKSFEDMMALTLDDLPQASTGYRFLMFTGPPVFSLSFLFDVPKEELAEEKIFSAMFTIGSKDQAILVTLEK